jgi:transcription antitermination factor NusG
LASPKWSKDLNTPTSSLKCGDMNGSTSTDKKLKYKDFVVNEVSESSFDSSEARSQDIQPTKKQSKLQVLFFRSILQVEFSHVYSLCNI